MPDSTYRLVAPACVSTTIRKTSRLPRTANAIPAREYASAGRRLPCAYWRRAGHTHLANVFPATGVAGAVEGPLDCAERLQPVLAEAGPAGIYTPRLVPKIGYCEYYCSLCTQVCPTGAIKKLTIEEKNKVKIGSAWVNKSRCIPYVLGKPCIVCEEYCPVSPKAIKFLEVEARLPDGSVVVKKAPVIDLELCTGCGICENKCPIVDDPAIFVTSVGETRSTKNRLLLDIASETTVDPYK